MSPEQQHPTAVFVNQSGRRRRLIMIGSIGASVLALALLAVVIAGMFSSTTLSVNGWPGDRSGAADGTASPDRTPAPSPKRSERPTPSVTRPEATRPPSRRPTPEVTRQARPSATSGQTAPQQARPTPRPSTDPAPSTRPATDPAADPTADPTADPPADPTGGPTDSEPPGQAKTPPGLDPNRTKGPKK
ncbi:hypothetical protein ACIBO5_42145 [Nonomuraea angiospora]|uniref:hypothetical protein n=1 Tax=Nonomuraea angiospora TaxID=46172 RepID=UPI0037AC3900